MKPKVSMREALADPALLGGALPGQSWLAWRVLLIASMGEALDADERAVFEHLTGREREPLELVRELWAIVGRRGGKTRAAGTFGAYVGALCDHTGYLAPGERGVLPILAASVSQASRAFMHARGILEHSPMLSQELDGEPTAGVIRLKTGIDIEIKPANFRTVRGITAPAAICDEVAFWMIENSANPDAEILNALRPALGTAEGPLMVISSPHAKRGELFKRFRAHYGADGNPRILIARGPTKLLNPTYPQHVIDQAYEDDAALAAAEYGAEFRSDIEAFIGLEVVEACVAQGVFERAYEPRHTYRAFVDPSGGSNDAMTLAIAHREDKTVVLDATRERKPPFSPEDVVADFCALLKAYGISSVTGDRYAGEFAREPFRRHGINYELAEHPRSDLYRDILPMLNSRLVSLLDSKVVVGQLVGLERRVARGGRESIDHAPGGHDDLANSVAGVVSLLRAPRHGPARSVPLWQVLGGRSPLDRRATSGR